MEKVIFRVREEIQEIEARIKFYNEHYQLVKKLIDFVKIYNPFYLMEEKDRISSNIVGAQNWLSIMYKHLDRLEKGEIQVENP